MKSLNVAIDNNVLIEIYNNLVSADRSFYRAIRFLTRNKILVICYSNFNIVEFVQTNNLIQILTVFDVISQIENLHFFDHNTSMNLVSSKEEFLQRAMYKLFEFGSDDSLNDLGNHLQKSEDGKRIFEKYKGIKNNTFAKAEEAFGKINLQKVQTNFEISKGAYNHLQPHEVIEIFEEKYIKYYDKIKELPDARDLPSNIFSFSFFKFATGESFDERDHLLFKLSMIELLGYKQKQLKKTGALNSLVDNYYLTISEKFDLVVTEDKKLREKINAFQTQCKAISCSDFNKIVTNLESRYNK